MYRIVALIPIRQQATRRSRIPMSGTNSLCAGDAGAAIRSALAGGRICDFFLLVRSVLKPIQPPRPLSRWTRWEGTACYDCGYTIGSGEVY